MKSAGLNVPLMGGDGIYDPKYIQLAGATSNGDLATSVGAPTDSTDAGKKFLTEYQAAGYAEPAAAYGGYSYDAANAIITALKTLARQRDRRQVGPQRDHRGGRARSRSTASPARSRSTSTATPRARS